jgi:hypothetical protein
MHDGLGHRWQTQGVTTSVGDLNEPRCHGHPRRCFHDSREAGDGVESIFMTSFLACSLRNTILQGGPARSFPEDEGTV